MVTGLLCARNMLGQGPYDPWLVNTDAEYHEGQSEADDQAGRAVPVRLKGAPPDLRKGGFVLDHAKRAMVPLTETLVNADLRCG
ncbi:MAG: hypothetical protein P4L84_29555 [Isosphaeraceae bacterium]|nr:hypothetical protein [Isosphaeraceae bacterium]